MRQIAQSIWWWTRVALLVIVAGYAMAVLWNNSGGDREVSLWYWMGRTERTSVVALAMASFLVGAIVGTTTLALFRASVKYRRTREVRRLRLLEGQRELIARKAAMLRVKPAPEPIVRVKEPPRPVALATVDVPLVEPRPMRAASIPLVDAPATAIVVATTEPATLPVVAVPDEIAVTTEPSPAAAEDVTATHVETARATPFAMSPIAPRPGDPQPPERLPIVEEDQGRSRPT